MNSDPFAGVADVVPSSPQGGGDPFAGVADVVSNPQPKASAPAWASSNRPFKLSNGAQTVLRHDGYVWLDPSKGDASLNGWYRWTGQSWEKGPDAPEEKGPRLTNFRFPNGTTSVQRPDGSVYIKAANDPSFQGDEGWKLFDPQTGRWAPSSPRDASTYGWAGRNLGPEAIKSWGRNMAAGLSRPGDALGGLVHDLAYTVGLEGQQSYLDNIHALEERERQRQAVKNTSGTGAGFTQFTGEIAPTIAAMALVPEAAPTIFESEAAMAPTLASFTQRATANALTGAATSYLTTPGSQEERTKAAITAGVAAPIAQFGIEKAAVPAARALGRAVGWVEGQMPKAMEELQAIADRHNVRLFASNLDKGYAKTEDALTHIPFSGMAEEQVAQRSDAAAAAERLLGELKSKVRGQGTPSEIAQGAGRANQTANNAIGHELYEAEAKLAGSTEAPRNHVIAAMKEEIADTLKASKPDNLLASDLETRIRRLTQNSREAGRAGELPMDKSFAGLKELKTEFWKEAQRFDRGTPEYARFMRLANAAGQDMDDFVANSSNPALQGVHDIANQWWKTKVKAYSPDSFEVSAWAKQLHGKDLDPEHVMDYFIQADQAGKAKYFYNGLDENGRAAVRWGIVRDAFNKATSGGDKTFSPGTFATEMAKKQEAVGVFFRGESKWQIDGFTKLMRAIEDSGAAGYAPKTGKAAILPMIAGGQGSSVLAAGASLLQGHPLVAAGAATTAAAPTVFGRLGKALLTTPAGKRLLLAASNCQPGSKAMNNLLLKDLPKVIGVSEGETPANVIPFLSRQSPRPEPPATPSKAAHNEEGPANPIPPFASTY